MQPCSLLAAGEPLAGTAPHARGWILVEHPGAWARDAVAGATRSVAHALGPVSGEPDVRVQLVRRPGPQPSTPASRRRVVLAHVGAQPWIETLEVADEQLADLPWEAVTGPAGPGIGADTPGRLLLVCTHGNRDRCCAEHGRPIAAALEARLPGTVWETTHIGGHRFAGNVVELPSGLVLGHLDTARALAAADELDTGRLPLDDLRGRSGLDPIAQAAEILARIQLADRTAGTVEARVTSDGVLLELAGAHFLVRLHREPIGRAYPLSCGAVATEDPGRFVLDRVEGLD